MTQHKNYGGKALALSHSFRNYRFCEKFNSGQVDAIAAPAYAYKPLEIGKGVGVKGAIFTFP